MFKKCPMCGKSSFALFRKLTACPKCGAEVSAVDKKSSSGKGIQYPPRGNVSVEDDLKRQRQEAMEHGGGLGSVNIMGSWDNIFENRPLNIPFYTAIGDRPVICIYFSAGTLPDPGFLAEFVQQTELPFLFQAKAFLEGAYPILRANLVIPDNPADPLALESPLNLADGNVQDFCRAAVEKKAKKVDVIMTHESVRTSKGEYISVACEATLLGSKIGQEVKAVAEAFKPDLTSSEFIAAKRKLEQVFPSAAAGVDRFSAVKLTPCGEAKYKFIKYS